MRRHTAVAFALLATVLMATQPMAVSSATSDSLVVGSQHTTSSDFSSATLTNMSVNGSGESASVVLDSAPTLLEGFEDGDITEYGGSTGSASAQTGTVRSGTYALQVDSSDSGGNMVSSTDYSTTTGENYTGYVQLTGSDSSGQVFFHTQSESDIANGYYLAYNDYADEIRMSKVTDSGFTTLDSASYAPSTGAWLKIEWRQEANGDILATFYDSNGNAIDTLTATDLTFTSGGIGFRSTRDTAYYDDFERGGVSVESGQYRSPVHDSTGQAGAINVSLTNATANATYFTDTDDDGTFETSVTTESLTNGNQTLSLGSNSYDDWVVEVEFNRTGDSPVAELHDESILFANHAPTATNLKPADNANLTDFTATLSADVSDSEFGSAQGENVAVEFVVDGEVAATETVSSNGTVSKDVTVSEAGTHEWYVRVTDSYGATSRTPASDTRSFQTPGELSIRNESAPSELVDNVTVTLNFYGDDFIVERNTTDGTINMTGLPADQPFVVVAEADGYLPRRIYVESFYATQSVYLLNDSRQYVTPTWTMEDYTGDYPPGDTVLIVQRALNGSWETVQGDFFGASEKVGAQLQHNVRHQIILKNAETGDQRIVGPYTPLDSSPETIVVRQSDTLVVDQATAYVDIEPSVGSLPALNGTNVAVTVENRSAPLESWNVTVQLQNTSTTTTLATYNSTVAIGGTYTADLDLNGTAGQEVVVLVNYSTTDGAIGQDSRTFVIREAYQNENSLLNSLEDLGGLVPQGQQERFKLGASLFAVILGTTAIAGATPMSTEMVGFTAVGMAAAWAVIGWLPYTYVFVAGAAWTTFAGLRRGV